MKKLFLIVLLLIGFYSAQAQSTIIQKANTYGLSFNRTGADTLFFLPRDTFPVPVGYQAYAFLASKSNRIYQWNTSLLRWDTLAGGSGSGGTTYTFPSSVTAPGNAIQLENDTIASPAGYFYGRNSVGRRGWELPANIYNTNGTVTGNRTVDMSTRSLTFNNASGYTFNWNQGGNSSYLTGSTDYFEALLENGSVGGSVNITPARMQLLKYKTGARSEMFVFPDSVSIKPHLGRFLIDTLTNVPGTKALRYNPTTGLVSYADTSTGGGSTSLSALTAATGSNTINSGAFQQEWQWNSLAGGLGLYLSANTTAAASNTQSLFAAITSGANANSTQTTYAGSFGNNHTGTASTNIGVYSLAENGTTNVAGRFVAQGGTTNRAIESTGGVRHTSLGTASTDTSTYKPVGINSSGDIIPMSNWAAGSGANAIYTLQQDTITLASFVAGARFVADTAAFTDSTLYGAFYNDGSDTLVITGLRGVMNGGTSDTLRVQVYYNDSLNVIGSSLLTSPHPLNSTTVGNTADADDFIDGTIVKIPPGNWVWMKSPTVVAGRKPWFLSVSLFGYKARR